MNRVLYRRCLPALLLVLALGIFGGNSSVASGQGAAQASTRQFLPVAAGNVVPKTIFGVEITQAASDRNLGGARSIGATFVRRSGLVWKDTEPTEGAGYNWAAPSVQFLEQELRNISGLGQEAVLVVRGSPRWATVPYQSDCAPIHPAKYARFAAFLAAAVDRYGRPPYNVRYWEIGNEPDAPVGNDSLFGCWGIASDPYFGGRAYGAMLRAVYPAIKAVNPAVQVMNGSLLLDKPDTLPAKFLEGVLLAGAGGSFDVLGYHSYCHYQYNGNADGVDSRSLACTSDWKVGYLRGLLTANHAPAKPLFNTEAALLCPNPSADCRQAQADFVGRNFARAMKDGLAGNIWYMFDSDSFRNTSLVDPANPFAPRPAYAAFRQASQMLGETQYLGVLGGQPAGVEGYRFRRGSDIVTVAWSNTSHNLRVPVSVGTDPVCLGRDGQTLACVAAGGAVTMSVGRSPVYIVGR